jgi:hypothetical protein
MDLKEHNSRIDELYRRIDLYTRINQPHKVVEIFQQIDALYSERRAALEAAREAEAKEEEQESKLEGVITQEEQAPAAVGQVLVLQEQEDKNEEIVVID